VTGNEIIIVMDDIFVLLT